MKYLTQAEFREVWITALESGEYKQSDGRLDGPHGFCCLGVAAHLASTRDDIDVEIEREITGNTISYREKGSGRDSMTLGDGMVRTLGLHDGEGSLMRQSGEDAPDSLVIANDDGMSFKEIAKLLRAGCYWR